MERVGDPLLKVALPGDVEQVACNPEANDRKMAEMSSENLLIKLLFGYSIVTLEIVSRCDAVPDATGCRVLCQTLTGRWEFRCHLGKGSGKVSRAR